jgi:hypothetical protein
MNKQLLVPISLGELIDKITILQIKLDRIRDQNKLVNINKELNELDTILDKLPLIGKQITVLTTQLRTVNEELWDIENYKRQCEHDQTFNDNFINAARQVYIKNDRRAAIKREINMLTGSDIIEEKRYYDINTANY